MNCLLLGKKGLGCRAKCKDCGCEFQGLVSRMKDHKSRCVGDTADDVMVNDESNSQTQLVTQLQAPGNATAPHVPAEQDPVPSTSSAAVASGIGGSRLGGCHKIRRLDNFVMKTSKSEKEALDEQIAKFVYATNSSFRIVKHDEFIRMIQLLRPGYTPPSRFDVAGKLLDGVHKKSLESCHEMLKGKTVCISLDGWSNVHNEPVICATVTSTDSEIFLVDTVDTSGNSHTSDYLVEVAVRSIQKCEKQFGCSVQSVVTDNAANVAKMREELQKRDDIDVITYGCSAHLMNLLAKIWRFQTLKCKLCKQ